MCCIATMPMEKKMKIFKGAVIGCLKSKSFVFDLLQFNYFSIVRHSLSHQHWKFLVSFSFVHTNRQPLQGTLAHSSCPLPRSKGQLLFDLLFINYNKHGVFWIKLKNNRSFSSLPQYFCINYITMTRNIILSFSASFIVHVLASLGVLQLLSLSSFRHLKGRFNAGS